MMYIDADDQVAGRLASQVAKMLVNGEEIMLFNAEKAVITGNPVANKKTFMEKVQRGDPYHGPFYPKRPDRVLKRMIRGMLPYKRPRGRDAFQRLKVFISVPEEFKDKPLHKIEGAANAHKCKYITLADIAVHVSGKV
jgi:large subunit ribosomal protein L13